MGATVAFWAFLAILVVAVSWRKVSIRREAETTIRLAIEKGQPLDPAVIEKMLGSRQRPGDDGLLLLGAVGVAVGIGLPLAGYLFERSGETGAFYAMSGSGVLTGLVGLAFLMVWTMVRRRRTAGPEQPST